jgi:hypothetical protein
MLTKGTARPTLARATPGRDVKRLPKNEELYVLARSHARILKERAIRRRKLKWLWAPLKEISAIELSRNELLMKLGAAPSPELTVCPSRVEQGMSDVGPALLKFPRSFQQPIGLRTFAPSSSIGITGSLR